MLIPILAAGFAAFVQSIPIQTVASVRREETPRRQVAAVDSARALRAAHRAQEHFESVRRQNLPHEFGVGSHHCDVRVGRWCVWNDETNDRKAPAEAARVIDARAKLLALLDSVGARYPGDEWIAAQSVRYLIEAKRYADAVRVTERCSAGGSPYLCRAFAGVALHDSGNVSAADSAFSAALRAMPDSVRCRWNDISLLIDDDLADRYEHADCAARGEIEAAFWSLTTPLYLRDHDFRNEFLARVTRTEMDKDSRTPMGSPAESAFRETALRYGYDSWFVRGDPPAGSMGEAPIAGYREGGSGFNFVPSYDVFATPIELSTDDWDLRLRSARTIYAPAYARRFRPLPRHQIALFRRGDSALVIAAYDATNDTLFTRAPLDAGLFVASVDSTRIGPARGTVEQRAAARAVLTTAAPWGPMLVSLELLDSTTKSAARARYGVRPPAQTGRIGVSDLLIFAPVASAATPRRLGDVVFLALHDDHVSASQQLGLFWETYGVRPEGESFSISLTIERIRDGWARRAAQRLHLATPFSPMRVQWQEVPDQGDHVASRSVALDLSQLEPGRYQIRLAVTPRGEAGAVATREVVVTK